MKFTYKHTMIACYICFIIQSIVNNFSPLLFVTYSRQFNISLEQITLLVAYNFIMQMMVDAIGARYVEQIGYRRGIVIAHITSFIGVAGLGVFPFILPPFAGLIVATTFCALGSGFIEVLASPIVEALPTDEKSAAMSLLHSFYCWGHILIVLLSTLFFTLAGTENWRILAMLWSLIPALNCIVFLFVPIVPYNAGNETVSAGGLLKMKEFWVFLVLMVCVGASEQAIAQWASLFAETGLHVSKTVGDLMGPCLFGLMMAISRTIYGSVGGRINLPRFMVVCAAGVTASYLLTVFAPVPMLSLVGCGLAGLFVGIFWPGTLSLATRALPQAGTSMFAMLALAGDIGCTSGPSVIGFISGKLAGDDALKGGILASAVFPIGAFVILLWLICKGRKKER
ncbi:MAG: MFS transporter [Clostridia bacterium]|nr:MFS transporter [Clostridia bacterium]